MSDEVFEPKKKKKSADELINASIDDLSNEELDRRTAIIRAKKEEADLQDIRERLDDRSNKREMRKEQFESRGRELIKTASDQKRHQEACSHRKGGRGLEALQRGGTAPDYAIIKHLLPWNEWYMRCQRCGKTWKPVHREDYSDDAAGQAAYDKDHQEYRRAWEFPTDNTPSTGITFQYSDGGEFAHSVTKETTLR